MNHSVHFSLKSSLRFINQFVNGGTLLLPACKNKTLQSLLSDFERDNNVVIAF